MSKNDAIPQAATLMDEHSIKFFHHNIQRLLSGEFDDRLKEMESQLLGEWVIDDEEEVEI